MRNKLGFLLGFLLLLLGVICFVLAESENNQTNHRIPTTTAGDLNELNQNAINLRWTIWSASTKIFGGLCIVAGAIALTAERRREPDRALARSNGANDGAH
jgi:uncharacterized membrane protein